MNPITWILDKAAGQLLESIPQAQNEGGGAPLGFTTQAIEVRHLPMPSWCEPIRLFPPEGSPAINDIIFTDRILVKNDPPESTLH